ncbi:hypothetical protein BH10PSE19_BH10PSE19_15750 [soil metagenome]
MESDIIQHWLPSWTPYILSAGFILIFIGLINLVNLLKKYKHLFFAIPTEGQPAYAGQKSPPHTLTPSASNRRKEAAFSTQRISPQDVQHSELDPQKLDELKRRLQFSIQALSLALITHKVKGITDLEEKQNQLISLLEEYLNTHHQLTAENNEYAWNAFFLEKNLVGKIVDITLELKHALSKTWSDNLRPDVHRMGNTSVAYLNARHSLLDNYRSNSVGWISADGNQK